jgi:NTE family protein
VIAVSVNSDLCGRGSVIPHLESLPAASPPEPESEARDEGMLARNGRAVKKLLQRQFFGRTDNSPGISRVMVEAFNIVQDRISRSRLAGDPPDMIIQPRMPDCGLFDFHRADEFIQAGAKAVRRDLDDIKREIAARCSPTALLARSA